MLNFYSIFHPAPTPKGGCGPGLGAGHNKPLPFYSPKIPAKNRIGPHNEDILSVIVGNLLGDGWAENRAGNTRLHIHSATRNVEYLMWLHKFYADRGYCSHKLPELKRNIGSKNKVYFSYKFRTWTYSNWNWIYDHFYINKIPPAAAQAGRPGEFLATAPTQWGAQPHEVGPGPGLGGWAVGPWPKIKVVPSNISQLLTPLTLAVWILDDGGVRPARPPKGAPRGYHPSGLIISTYNFNANDLNLLQKALINNFDLVTSVFNNKNGLVLYFPKNQLSKLSNIVKIFMVPGMF